MQIIGGVIGSIILLGFIIFFIVVAWKFLLLVGGGWLVYHITNKLIEYRTPEEEKKIKTIFYGGYAVLVCIGLFLNFSDIKFTSNKSVSQNTESTQTKTPEQIQAEKDAEKLKNQIEHVSKLTGEDKNFYDTKFKEYINAGQDENSAREKALADLTEMQKQKFEEQRKAEEERKKAEEEQKRQAQVEKAKAEQAEREKNYLANNYNEIYQWCYWMFYKIGYSDDVLQYHMNSGAPDAMSDLKFVMNKFSSDVQTGHYTVSSNIPENIKNIMHSARNNLQKSFMLRRNGNRGEIQKSNQLENEVVQQLIQIQQMLPEGVKYRSYQGIYDSDDDIAPDYYQNKQNEGRVYIDTNEDGFYGQS